MKENHRQAVEISSASFWEQAWLDLEASFIAASQRRHPDRWSRFYETHGPNLRAMSGLGRRQGAAVVQALCREGVVLPEGTAVDLGCGTGWLALPLALCRVRVLAVDTSASMLEDLQRQAAQMKLATLETRRTCWTRIQTKTPFDLALAACFPPALCPEGVSRMETLGRRCALVLASGGQGFPWVKRLWMALCGRHPFSGPRQLQTALNYLMVTDRKPALLQLSIPMNVDLPLEPVLAFYDGYFSLFDKTGPEAQAVIRRELAPFARQGRIQAEGTASFGLIWWNRLQA